VFAGYAAYKAGFINICELGKERLRRAGGEKVKSEAGLMGKTSI
jgi:hypothetical protein